jgi:lambda family phage portal protein
MDLITRALSVLAPQAALRRLAARSALETLARDYDAARRGRRTSGWKVSSGSQNAENEGALDMLRDRARDLVRNNAWAKKAALQIPADLVGTGVTPLPQGSQAARRRATAAWNRLDESCDPSERATFGSLQHLVCRTVIEAGEALVVWRVTADRRLTCQVLEPDHLDDTASPSVAGNVVLGGIEIDPNTGRRVAYHLTDRHPGDPAPLGRPWRRRESRPVPAADVDHVFDTVRPGQLRGVPWLAASALKLRDLDEYDDAELWRKKIAACLSAFVITPDSPAASPLGQLTTDNGRLVERIAPAMVKRLKPGEDVKFTAPPADSSYGEFFRLQLHSIAAGVGIPYALLSGDMTQANYSSLRFGNLMYWALLDCWQWHMVAPQFLARTWRRLSAHEIAQGRPALPATRWAFPRRRWVDPEKEAAGELAEIQAGTLTWEDAVAARGEDPETQLDSIAAFQERLRARGITLSVVPNAAPAARAPAPPPPEQETPPNA